MPAVAGSASSEERRRPACCRDMAICFGVRVAGRSPGGSVGRGRLTCGFAVFVEYVQGSIGISWSMRLNDEAGQDRCAVEGVKDASSFTGKV